MPDERDDRLDEIKKILYAFKAEVSLRGAFQASKKACISDRNVLSFTLNVNILNTAFNDNKVSAVA